MNYMQQPMKNPKDISDPTTVIDITLALMAKTFTLNNTTLTNNNQRSSSDPNNMQIAQSGMNMDQDKQMLMVEDNVGNQFRPNAVQNVRNQIVQNAIQNPGIQIVKNLNGLSAVSEITNQYGNINVVTARTEGSGNGINGNLIRCYNYRGLGHYASNCTVKPRKRDAAYLQQQLQITQEEEAGIQSTQGEFKFMAAAEAYEETKRVKASTSGTRSDKAPIYDSDGSVEYTKLLEPIPKPHQVPQNDSNVISEVSSMEQGEGTVEQHPVNIKETCVLYDSLYNNLAIEVEKVNSVNRKLRETNADLTTELARYKNQEKCFEISHEKYDKLESSDKQITTLNEEISNLNNQLSKEKSTVSTLLEEKKKLKSDFKIRKDELLDKQIQLENKKKELDNILVKKSQSIQTIHMLSPKPDLFYHTEQKMAIDYQNPFYLKQAQQKQQSLYNGKVLLESMILLLGMIQMRHCNLLKRVV
uniref:CCHC-type domain-containing protein n=1 Tax=Tanacetum cinerariifolium TaxID=118510 RepID=A0A699HNT8_TANCI|nr:hypothetical protein [Tanacetum cinerariifolium]